MELNIPIKEKDKTRAILKLLNPFISNLTNTEINIVATMIDLGIDSLDRYSKKRIKESLRMDDYSFNNYVRNLKAKGIFIQTIDDVKLNENLNKYTTDSTYTINFIVNE